MNTVLKLAAAVSTALAIGAGPSFAEPGKGNGKNHDWKEHRGERGGVRLHHVADCPPGLAKKNPPCVPPGQARHDRDHYGRSIGEILRTSDYRIIRDLDRYRLEDRRGWDYYRDADRIYRVDSETRKILAILNLVDAFSN